MTLGAFTLLAYWIGSFPTGVVLSRRKYGIDVREMGSGNTGATNITRTFGWYAGAVTFLIDSVKGFVPLYLVRTYFSSDTRLVPLVGIALVAGHCFSGFLRFRGGKGVATSLGCFAAVDPWLAATAVATYVAVLALSRISAVGSLAAVGASLIYLAWRRPPEGIVWMALGICVLVAARHHSNIRRLIWGLKQKKMER